MKFILFVEGHTERLVLPSFLKRWLDPRLKAPVGIRPVRFEGWPDYEKGIATKVALNVPTRPDADVIAGIGLLDLYGPTFYPPDVVEAAARRDWAKRHLEAKVNHTRFRQHFAVHELEAWLLANPAILPADVRGALAAKSADPEKVDFDEPPSKLLQDLYWGKLKQHYKKITEGQELFRALDPGLAYEKCPNLRAMLDDMLALAHGRGL
jgi:hypothetical protein